MDMTDHDRALRPPASDGERSLRAIGFWLLAASLLWWIAAAALIPSDDFFLGETARDESLSIADHEGLFRAFHVVAGAGVVAAGVGIVLLGRWLRARRPSRIVDVTVLFVGLGAAAWLIEIAVRLTVGIDRAREVAAGRRAPAEEPAVGSLPLFLLAWLAFLAPVLCSWILARRGIPSRRASMVVGAVATLATAAAVATMAPSVVYQFAVLTMAVTLVLANRTGDRVGGTDGLAAR